MGKMITPVGRRTNLPTNQSLLMGFSTETSKTFNCRTVYIMGGENEGLVRFCSTVALLHDWVAVL
jgi:hypothetical protein